VVLISALMFAWSVLMPGKEKAPAFGGVAEPAE
jgi:nitric oxide reductase subunit B